MAHALTKRQQAVVDEFMDKGAIPGVAVAVVYRGETRIGAFGVRDVASGAPVTADTLFPLASVSKSFTATAVMHLVEKEKLKLDEPVRRHLPNFCLANPGFADEVAVRMLLNHTSGLGRTLHLDPDAGRSFSSREQLVGALADYVPQTAPGVAWSYSNEAFSLAGRLVDVVAGTDYETYVRREVLHPLGMGRSTPYIEDWLNDDNRAVGYANDGTGVLEEVEPLPDAPASTPAGRISSTAADMARYVAAVIDYDGNPVLSSSSLHEMHKARPRWGDTSWGYGLGWSIDVGPGGKVVRHGGNQRGVATHVLTVPKEGLGIAVLTNLSRAPADHIAERLANATLGWPLLRKSLADPLPVTTEYLPNRGRLADVEGEYRAHLGTLRVEAADAELRVVQRLFEPEAEHRLQTVAVADDVFVVAHGGPEGQPITFLRNGGGRVERALLAGTPYDRRT